MIPSGKQLTITNGDQRATIVEVGGGIRTYDVGGRHVLHPYDAESICDGAHGAPLIPWPNRLGDGRYSFEGTNYQVGLTEPDKQNAIHGFLRWRSWQAIDHSDDAVTMRTTLHPLKGYPFALDVQIRYVLSDDGLTVTARSTNCGDRALPYGFGQHPYLATGGGPIDPCRLEFAAGTRVDVDAERQLPTADVAVDGTEYDFSTAREIGSTIIDFAFRDLARDDDGRAWVRLTGSDDRMAQIWVDETVDYLELYTADTLAPERRRMGLGVEPMTCPPNAFASGDVIRLAPGETTTACWGAQLR